MLRHDLPFSLETIATSFFLSCTSKLGCALGWLALFWEVLEGSSRWTTVRLYCTRILQLYCCEAKRGNHTAQTLGGRCSSSARQ